MNIGWILLGCALIILAIMALVPWRGDERTEAVEKHVFRSGRNFSTRLDEYDARLIKSDEVMRLLRAGQKIKAIQLYRGDTGASLSDARAAVERMELALKLGIAPGITQAQGDTFDPKSEVPGSKREDISLSPEIENLLIQGKKIEAIKVYRQQTGVGLREAKDAIDLMQDVLLERGPSFSHSQADDWQKEASMSIAEPPGEEVRRHVLAGDKILAIKAYRQQTGLPLKEAKQAVERLEQTLRQGMEQA